MDTASPPSPGAARAPSPRAVLVTGGTGFIGRALVRALRADGREVTVLARDPVRAAARLGPGVAVLADLAALPAATPVDAIVALAGARVVGPPWTAARRRLLVHSRVDGLARLAALCARLERRPAVVVGASAVGWYGAVAADRPLDESAPAQPGQFQSDLCIAIEQALERLEAPGTRVVRLRPGVVLGPGDGAWPSLAAGARLGLAAVLGSGRQAAPWIHLDDVVGLIRFALDHPALAGPVNATAPDTRTQAEFTRALAAAFHRPAWLHVPAPVLRLMLGEMSELLVAGQNVVPRAALAAGYVFAWPDLPAALAQLARA